MESKCSASYVATIQFHDIDSMGVMWHGHYPKLLETARDLVLKQCDFGYEQMVASGIMWPIVEMKIKYKKYIKLHQEVLVQATLKEYENRLVFHYSLYDNNTKELLTKASTTQVGIDMKTQDILFVLPDEIVRKFAS